MIYWFQLKVYIRVCFLQRYLDLVILGLRKPIWEDKAVVVGKLKGEQSHTIYRYYPRINRDQKEWESEEGDDVTSEKISAHFWILYNPESSY